MSSHLRKASEFHFWELFCTSLTPVWMLTIRPFTFFSNIHLKIIAAFLAASGLKMLHLGSSLWHTVLVAPQHVGSYFPNQGSNPHPLHWKGGFLTTGPPGKPQALYFQVNRVCLFALEFNETAVDS